MNLYWATISILILLSGIAYAAPRRIAVIIGNNHGGPAKERLRYAERDARRMARVLRTLGDVKKQHLLLGQKAGALRMLLHKIRKKYTVDKKPQILFFYYSGHADHGALLMGGTRFPYSELRKTLVNLPASVRIAFIDACQAGMVTRGKGGRLVPTLNISFGNQKSYRGRVFITSSTAGEKSQESDRLQASFFTHYLISALRGAADISRDRRVSLQEAYRYVYQQTLRRTASTMSGPQHPALDIDMKGKGQLILTQLSTGGTFLSLKPESRGSYLIYSHRERMIVAELNKRSPTKQRLALMPGRYEIRKRAGDHYLAKTVILAANRDTVLDESNMVQRAFEQTKAKGSLLKNNISLAYEYHSGFLRESASIHGVRLGYGHLFGPLWLGGAAGYGQSTYSRLDGLAVTCRYLIAALGADLRLVKSRWVELLSGVELGLSWLWQKGTLQGGPPETLSSTMFHYRGRFGISFRITGPWRIAIWGHLGQIIYSADEGVKSPFVFGLNSVLSIIL